MSQSTKKICTKCKEEKILLDFSKLKHGKLGRDSWCKKCKNNHTKNKIKNNEQYRKKLLEQQKEYRKTKGYRISQEKYRNSEKGKKTIEKYEKSEIRRNLNKKSYKKYNKKRHSTKQGKLKRNISALIYNRLKNRSAGKNNKSSFDFLPYTLEELIQHLENQFTNGMCWNNYGRNGWVIDHIIPDSKFNYSSLEDKSFQECWSLKNLQPMWFKDNASKNNKDYKEWIKKKRN